MEGGLRTRRQSGWGGLKKFQIIKKNKFLLSQPTQTYFQICHCWVRKPLFTQKQKWSINPTFNKVPRIGLIIFVPEWTEVSTLNNNKSIIGSCVAYSSLIWPFSHSGNGNRYCLKLSKNILILFQVNVVLMKWSWPSWKCCRDMSWSQDF